MQLPTEHPQRIKNVIHGLQGFVIFVAWTLTIAVFIKSGNTDGRTKYFFALCFFTIPFLIYLAAVPVFNRTKRFANPYAFAAIDILFTILWLAAFSAVAAWTNAGKDGGCTKFKFGSPGKCNLSEVTVGLGVAVCLLFVLTSAISVYALLYYRRNGSMPGATPSNRPIEDQTKHAFSPNPHEHDEFNTSDPELGGTAHGYQNPHAAAVDDEDDYEVLHPQPADEGVEAWGQRHGNGELDGEDTSYHGANTGYGQRPPHQDPFRNPSPYRDPSPAPSYHQGGSYEHPSALQAGGGAGDPFRDDLGLSHAQGGYSGPGGRVNIPDVNDFRPR